VVNSVSKDPPARLSAGSRLTSIQGLRGVAACLVAAMHCLTSTGGLLATATPLQHEVTMAASAVGGAGVDIFFVISGFIILTLAQRRLSDADRFGEAWRFLLRRFGRIYPLYWVTVAVISAAAEWYTRNIPTYHLALNVSEILLTTTHLTLQMPAWTLVFELWFYLGAASLMLLPARFFTRAMLAWALAQALLMTMHLAFEVGPDWPIFTKPQVMDFFIGCAVAHACARRVLSFSRAISLLLVSAGIFMAGFTVCYLRLPAGSLTDAERFLYWGISAGIMLWSLVSLEVRAVLKTPAWLQRLGDESYSIYLWHSPIMAIAFTFGLQDVMSNQKLAQAGLEIVATLLVAWLSYRFIELPTMRFVQNLARPRRLRIPLAQ